PVVNRVARLMATAWGGQIILTPEVMAICPLPDGASLQDLGLHQLKDLAAPQQVFGLVHADLALQEFPTLRSMSSQPNNLPRQPTPLVGREDELVEIGDLLSKPDCRLLTLVAPGGMGKTRLGLQAAAEQIEAFRHGVFFVPLAGVVSADNIPSTIANALKLSFYGDEDLENQLHSYLAGKQLLLLLDNFEHLVDGAGAVADILMTAPGVKILATSRRQLRLHAEWTFDVPGLSVPENGSLETATAYSSVALFMQSARRVRPGFDPPLEEVRAIIRVCRLVDGMPLALELAAAWVKTLNCQEIAAEIEADLDLLATEMQDVPLRQRSVRAVFEHSWGDLSSKEQAAFAKLSVFRGGFSRDAAQSVTGATIRIVSDLINNSLLTRDSNGRFQLHELLRQFAAQKLEEDEESCQTTQGQHAAYFSDFLKGFEQSLIRGARTGPIKQINGELDNVLLAWQWAIEGANRPLLEDAMRSLFWFYEAKAWYSEGEEAFRAAAEALADSGEVIEEEDNGLGLAVTNLRIRQAWFASRLSRYKDVQTMPGLTAESAADQLFEEGDLEGYWVAGGLVINTLYGMGDYATARRFLEGIDERLERDHEYRYTWPWAKGQNLANLGRIDGALGNYEEARQLLQEGVDILRPLGDYIGIMLYLHTLGGILRILGEAGEARHLFQEGLDLAEIHNYPMGKILALGDLGDLAYAEGEYENAREHFESSLTLSEEIGDSRGRALALTNLGRVATALGEYEEARRLFERGLAITAQSGNRRGTALTLDRLSQVHRLTGDLDQAHELCRKSWEICQELGYRKGAILALISRGEMALEREELRAARKDFHDSLQASEDMGFVSGVMRSQIGLGRTALGVGELEQAKAHLRRGLTVGGESRQKRAELSALLSLAETMIASDDLENGLQLLSLTANHPAADRYTREKAAADLEALEGSFDPAQFEALANRGRKLTLAAVRKKQASEAAE
ncbi:MAG: tetratricopeptide repeat protein, partial [Chloroflexota bacterium]